MTSSDVSDTATAVPERPIIFSSPMVRGRLAILCYRTTTPGFRARFGRNILIYLDVWGGWLRLEVMLFHRRDCTCESCAYIREWYGDKGE